MISSPMSGEPGETAGESAFARAVDRSSIEIHDKAVSETETNVSENVTIFPPQYAQQIVNPVAGILAFQ
ncbi:MAG: hypothetical protein C5B58_08605 [Acidobacteria bacterium]|nr:MAG: hypothetical protein C5B58_08605 [Acidobacteriota bacterium]